MNNLSLIVAIGKNNELGKDNDLIWHLKEDMKFFKKMTNNIKLFSIITGVLFGFVHVISSLSNPVMILLTIPYSAVGISLGYAFRETDNIFASISMHMIHNTVLVGLSIVLKFII